MRAGNSLLIGEAQREDEPELRRLLRENPMEGEIRLTLEREPDYFIAAAVEGTRHAVATARVPATGKIVAMGSRSVRPCFINGQSTMLPYLGGFRVDPEARGRRRDMGRTYSCLRSLRKEDEPPFCLTSMAADNLAARRLLNAGIPGLPIYRQIESVSTLAMRCSGKAQRSANVKIRQASTDDLEEISAFLLRNGSRYQFHPCWTVEDLLSEERTPGLRPEDFFFAVKDGSMAGCAALWDQRAFKQTVVRGYGPSLGRVRPLANLIAPAFGMAKLPPVGGRVETIYLSHFMTEDESPDIAATLVSFAQKQAKKRGCDYMALGLSDRNPLTSALRRTFRHRTYKTVLYLVYWPEDASEADILDNRPAHPEIAIL